jgi:hypothetical protein
VPRSSAILSKNFRPKIFCQDFRVLNPPPPISIRLFTYRTNMSHWIMKLFLHSAFFQFNCSYTSTTYRLLLCSQTSWMHLYFPKFNPLNGTCGLCRNKSILVTRGTKGASSLFGIFFDPTKYRYYFPLKCLQISTGLRVMTSGRIVLFKCCLARLLIDNGDSHLFRYLVCFCVL